MKKEDDRKIQELLRKNEHEISLTPEQILFAKESRERNVALPEVKAPRKRNLAYCLSVGGAGVLVAGALLLGVLYIVPSSPFHHSSETSLIETETYRKNVLEVGLLSCFETGSSKKSAPLRRSHFVASDPERALFKEGMSRYEVLEKTLESYASLSEVTYRGSFLEEGTTYLYRTDYKDQGVIRSTFYFDLKEEGEESLLEGVLLEGDSRYRVRSEIEKEGDETEKETLLYATDGSVFAIEEEKEAGESSYEVSFFEDEASLKKGAVSLRYSFELESEGKEKEENREVQVAESVYSFEKILHEEEKTRFSYEFETKALSLEGEATRTLLFSGVRYEDTKDSSLSVTF